MGNLTESSLAICKCQTRADEIGKCLDEGLEPTRYFSIVRNNILLKKTKSAHFSKTDLSIRGKTDIQEWPDIGL